MKKKLKTKKKKVHRDLRPQTPNLPNEVKEESFKNEGGADRFLARAKYNDLKKACVLKGMKPEDVVKADHHRLASYLVDNFDRLDNEELLKVFDDFVEAQLIEKGYKKDDIMLSPSLRMSFTGNIENAKDIKIIEQKPKKVKEEKPPKEKRVKDEKTGVIKGTKKSMVYNLANEGLSLKKITKQVLEAFPDANEKSIAIWYKRVKSSKD